MTLESLDNDLKAVEAIAPSFWRSKDANRLNSDEREDVLQAARRLLWKYPFDDKRKDTKGNPISRQHYIRMILPVALKAWRNNEKLRTEAASTLAAAETEEYRREESMLDRVPDPLSVRRPKVESRGGVVLADEFSVADLVSPPYKVNFRGPTGFSAYSENPFHVPFFLIVPRYEGVLAVASHEKHRGKQRRFGKRDLPYWTQEVLDRRREDMASYVRALVPAYLRRFGFTSLDGKYKALLSDINKLGLRPKDIQAKRRISENSYYAMLNVLARRGWRKEWDPKKKRDVLRYNPVYDRCKSFYSNDLVDIENIHLDAVLNLAGPVIEDQLYRSEPSEEAVQRELRAVRDELRRKTSDMQAEAEFDLRLRSFIVDLIERPIYTGQSYAAVEERFGMMPYERRLAVFCEAVRTKQSIVDVLDLNLFYADVLYDRPASEEAQETQTLQSVFGLARVA